MVRALSGLFCLLLTSSLLAGEDTAAENRRLRDEIAALKANDPEGALRKAVEDYLAGPRAEDMPRQPASVEHQGGFAFRSEDGLHLMRLQIIGRTGWSWYRDNAESGGITQSGFRVPELRVRFSGHAYSERLTYFFDLEFGPNAERFGEEADLLSEARFTYRRPAWRWLRLRAGRFRPGFSAEEQAGDETLALVHRGLVHEYFTVGRSDGLAAILEGVRGGRSRVELSITNGSERFDPGSPFDSDDKRRAVSFRWARTLMGEGDPRRHIAYEGDPYDDPARVLVVGIGLHWEVNTNPDTPMADFLQATVDLTWRHGGTYASLQIFLRQNHAGGTPGLAEDDEDTGLQLIVSRFIIPRRLELAARIGWMEYAMHRDPGGDLLEATFGFSYYWKNEVDRFQGHRLRVSVDVGYAEHVAEASRSLGWPEGHGRGWQFRSLVTFFF